MFEGGFLADAHRGNLALLHLRLAADADDVAVADGGSHAVAVAGQRKVSVPRRRNADVLLDVLLGGDGGAAGDGAHQRHHGHGGQRLKARRRARHVQPQQIGRGGLQCRGQLFQLCLRNVVDPFFQLGNGGFGAVSHALGQLLLREAQFFAPQPDAGGKFGHRRLRSKTNGCAVKWVLLEAVYQKSGRKSTFFARFLKIG